MREAARWVLAALAAWRLAQFVVYDDGPFDLMLRLRILLGRYRLDEHDEPVTALGRFVACTHCVGKWAALGLGALALWPGWAGDLVLAAWGLAGAQSILEAKWGKRLRG